MSGISVFFAFDSFKLGAFGTRSKRDNPDKALFLTEVWEPQKRAVS